MKSLFVGNMSFQTTESANEDYRESARQPREPRW